MLFETDVCFISDFWYFLPVFTGCLASGSSDRCVSGGKVTNLVEVCHLYRWRLFFYRTWIWSIACSASNPRSTMSCARSSCVPATQSKRSGSKATPTPVQPEECESNLRVFAEDASASSYIKIIIDLLVETQQKIRKLRRINADAAQQISDLKTRMWHIM